MPPELIEMEIPTGRSWEPVMRMVLAGVAEQVDLGYDQLDDLQLAVERLLQETGSQDTVRISVELDPRGLRTRIGPLRETPIAEALTGPPPPPGELTLRRILETVVDSFGVEESEGGELVVRLEKAARR